MSSSNILHLLPPFKGKIRRWLDHVAGIYLLEDVLKHVCDHAGEKGIEKELIAQVCYKIFFQGEELKYHHSLRRLD